MRIDATHRRWAVGCVAAALAGAAVYAANALLSTSRPSGGSVPGLIFGLLASGMILFAWLLAARKKVLLLRVGSVTAWTRGHLWLGALSLPFALYHSAFRFGGPLTTVLMVLLVLVTVSGIIGAILQHVAPTMMTVAVEAERTYEQLERLHWQRRRQAYELVAAACGEPAELAYERAALAAQLGEAPEAPKSVKPAAVAEELKTAYASTILTYLADDSHERSLLLRSAAAMPWFDDLRARVDGSLHPTVTALANLCEEHRQQVEQRRLHRWLHGWLLCHVPLSMALIVLLVIHGVTALYY